MNLEELVRGSIDHGVDSLPKRDPDPDLLATRKRRSAVVRIALPALAAAAVIAVVGVVAVDKLGSSGDESSVATGDHTAAYMSWSGKVHLDGRTYKAKHAKGDAFEVNTITDAGFIYTGGDGYPYLLRRDGTELRIGASTNPGNAKNTVTTMAGSADHRYAAWATQGREELRVSLFDSQAGKVVAQRSIDCGSILPGGQCDDYYATVVADGVVYLDGASKGRPVSAAWNPALPASQQVYRVTDPGTHVTAVAAKTVMVTGDGTVYDRSGEPLGDDWTIVRTERRVDESDPYTLTADGRWYFVVGGKEETASEDMSYAVDSTTGERVELVANTGGVQIDDDGSVLVMTNGNNSTDRNLLDCALPSGECATVVEDVGESDELIGE